MITSNRHDRNVQREFERTKAVSSTTTKTVKEEPAKIKVVPPKTK